MIRVSTFRVVIVAGLMLSTVRARPANSQHSEHAVVDDEAGREFVDQVHSAIAPFKDRNAAIAAGYRQIGPDFPGMGEHWVHPRLIFSDSVRASNPPVLSYVELDGRPVLIGAAFALPLAGEDDPPELPFGDVWHVHEGTVDEETLVLNPGVRMRGTESSTRLAMFHVWTDLKNPDGVFHQDNWALPFVRLGLPVPDDVSPEAAKAVFLLDGGVAYYKNLIRIAASPGQAELMHLEQILQSASQDVRHGVEAAAPDPPDVDRLEAIWSSVREDLRTTSTPATWSELEAMFTAR